MEVYLKDKLVNVIINRKNNKNIYFRFDDDLNLVVNANKRIKDKEITKLINDNNEALYKLLNKQIKKNNKNDEFWYLGNKYEIRYTDIENIEIKEGIIYVPNEKVLNNFIKNETKNIFMQEVLELKKVIKTPQFTLKVRKMKTRWGVCNYKNMTITLNSELIKYSKEALRYVIIHEMCHFEYHNHGQDFWRKVSYYEPNYKEIRKELRG